VQFNQPRFVEMVRHALETSGIRANLLELEITENVTMHGIDKVRDKLRELSSMGVFFSIDDFGTGYSSLSYLQTFPLYSLKIDRSFVRNLHNNQANADIVSAIIALAHSLNLRVVAEGVETIEELGVLKEKNCDIIQGYLFGFPQPAENLPIPGLRD
jgi:EAL domain-containing protein (putative c-di-GMP-specific phosphodiesterase class I)